MQPGVHHFAAPAAAHTLALMNNCAFLMAPDLTDFVSDDELAIAPLAERGWRVALVSWRDAVDWNAFDAVVVRSTWDYQSAPEAFIAALARIDRSRARLANELTLMRWNMSKTYLRDLEAEGVAIPPTIWAERITTDDLLRYFDELSTDEIVVKPVVSANADDTYRVTRLGASAVADELARVFRRRDCIIQPFLRNVVEEGEYSVMFFNGEPSHTILKTPKQGDFRVQEEHGGWIRPIEPAKQLLASAMHAVDCVAPAPLYGRADFVRTEAGYALMELELIEPALYLRMDASAPARFADALVAWMAQVPA